MERGLSRPTYRAREESVVRFSSSQRFEHVVVMVAFIMLVATGMPQRFPDNSWSQWLIENLGGIHATRLVHRTFGFVLVFGACYHVGAILLVLLKKRPLSMLVTFKDFKDAIGAFRYDVGLSEQPPRYGRFDFREKFEYWGMVFGTSIMIMSGLILMYPVVVARFLPGQLIPVAKTMHGYEGLLALLIILVWHLYNAHFGPGKFPCNTTIFTGRISREHMEKEHTLEYEEMLKAEEAVRPGERSDGRQ